MAARGGQQQWLDAGQGILRRDGIGAVKLQTLTEDLQLTTGSFYHHFTSMADYLEQLARHYGTDQPVRIITECDDPDPLSRIRNLQARSVSERMGRLDAAMRQWAGSNADAADAVAAADAIVLGFLAQAFADLGFDEHDARVRAHLLFAIGVAQVSLPWTSSPEMIETAIAVVGAPRI